MRRWLFAGMTTSGDAPMTDPETEAKRAEFAALIGTWGVDIGGRRFGVVYGWDRDHLMESGAIATLCGVQDPEVMEDISATPSCARCLQIVTRGLQSTPTNPRLEMIAGLAVDVLAKSAEVYVHNVPGDQADRLRATIRKLMRARKLNVATRFVGGTVFCWSSDVYYRIPAEQREAEIREALEFICVPDASRRVSVEVEARWLSWTAWAE